MKEFERAWQMEMEDLDLSEANWGLPVMPQEFGSYVDRSNLSQLMKLDIIDVEKYLHARLNKACQVNMALSSEKKEDKDEKKKDKGGDEKKGDKEEDKTDEKKEDKEDKKDGDKKDGDKKDGDKKGKGGDEGIILDKKLKNKGEQDDSDDDKEKWKAPVKAGKGELAPPKLTMQPMDVKTIM